MNKKALAAACIMGSLSIAAGAAWFGESASLQERSELYMRGSFISVAYHLLYGFVYGNPEGSGILSVYHNIDALILMNPPLGYYIVHNIIAYFITILAPLYVMALLGTGLYMIFFSASVAGRKKAKEFLPRLAASMIVTSLSIPILRLMFQASYAFCRDLLENSGVPTHALFTETLGDLVLMFSSSAASSYDAGYIFLMAIYAVAIGTVTILAVRYVVLLAFTLVFPLAVFLYTFNISRDLGRFMLEQTILWTFLQAMITVALVVANLGVKFLGITGDLKTIAGITAFVLVFFSPVLLLTRIRRFLP
jgi:hypothetical protein